MCLLGRLGFDTMEEQLGSVDSTTRNCERCLLRRIIKPTDVPDGQVFVLGTPPCAEHSAPSRSKSPMQLSFASSSPHTGLVLDGDLQH